jgi:uncharacterized iron-regulated membrane protein
MAANRQVFILQRKSSFSSCMREDTLFFDHRRLSLVEERKGALFDPVAHERTSPGRENVMIHRIFVVLHRYTGLLMALFLFLVGLTGSHLAFNTELERVFAPQLFAKLQSGVPRLDFATLVFGRPYQIFVCLLGVLVAMLSVTGVYIWWKKCQGRLLGPRTHPRKACA